ncbi:MAG: SH3 domain-containing protein [Actinobacteria bacterium]|nr:SH3 domain-containing protein [Actinomycetota bacterium]
MSGPEDPTHPENVLRRAARVIVPWVGLVVVVAALWSFVIDYRSATGAGEPTATVEPATVGGVPEGGPYVVVLSDGLNLRAEPSTGAAVLKVLEGEARLLFIEEGTGWYHVKDPDGTEGWVAAGGRYTELVTP